MKQKFSLSILCFIGLIITTACSNEITPQQQSPIVPIQAETITTNEHIQATNQQIMAIATGTYIGECFEYCNEILTITPDKIHFVITSNYPDDSYPDLSSDVDIDSNTWDEIVKLADIENFGLLPEIIGCPDCSDQGGEWIEITSDKTTHRVDFEYGATVPEIDDLLAKLRELRESFTGQ